MSSPPGETLGQRVPSVGVEAAIAPGQKLQDALRGQRGHGNDDLRAQSHGDRGREGVCQAGHIQPEIVVEEHMAVGDYGSEGHYVDLRASQLKVRLAPRRIDRGAGGPYCPMVRTATATSRSCVAR